MDLVSEPGRDPGGEVGGVAGGHLDRGQGEQRDRPRVGEDVVQPVRGREQPPHVRRGVPGVEQHVQLELGERLKRRGMATDETYPFPLRQEHIAYALGLTAVQVSRTFATLRGEGLISLRQSALQIHDRERLIEISGYHARPGGDELDRAPPVRE